MFLLKSFHLKLQSVILSEAKNLLLQIAKVFPYIQANKLILSSKTNTLIFYMANFFHKTKKELSRKNFYYQNSLHRQQKNNRMCRVPISCARRKFYRDKTL
ncbi:MAG: hypothetical protein ACD_46C00021G0009 [uncultured bacterium]|nr:MAG: hypothetical protein ACD_46C00021G0009 [uncultured bacterium]